LRETYPDLKLVQLEHLSLFAYPLSGGFRSWSLISESMVEPLLKLEQRLLGLLGRFMAFRLLVVLEKRP
jgi:hypothetical protein